MLIIVATTSPDAHALSPCIPSDFALVYDDASTASLSDEQLVIVHAAVARMRECDIGQIEIFAASSRVAFWRQRAQALRTELIAEGIDATVIAIESPARPELPSWAASHQLFARVTYR